MPPGWSPGRSHLGFSLPVIINGLPGKIFTGNGNHHVWIALKENLQWETMGFYMFLPSNICLSEVYHPSDPAIWRSQFTP